MANVTRFDTFNRPANEAEGLDERVVIRLFDKRKLVGEYDVEDIVRDDWEETLPDFIKTDRNGSPRSIPVSDVEVLDFLGDEYADEESEEGVGGSVVPEKYRVLYGSEQNCGDDMAKALTEYVTLGRVSKKSPDGGLDIELLRKVAADNGLSTFLQNWENRGLNGGLLRMNISNMLRRMVRNGERVKVNNTIWEADPKKVKNKEKAKTAPKKSK